MINTLITSKTRIKLLLKFFLNPENSAHLRGLESELGESSNAIRLELNRLEEANMLSSELQGNRKYFKVNDQHPLYNEINSIVKKYFGLDMVVEWIAKRLGNLHAVYLTGDIAKGKDSDLIDLILVGVIDQNYLLQLITKAEKVINRKIRYLILTDEEFVAYSLKNNGLLLVWESNV
ncbi:MAG: ArsR family transcriptional regulator [Cyclobacteriaceae bacterium]|nr:ArsR family transcriptional regulator [Cyclobacteriaceae bacterium]